ncbi:MAG: allophanate hydrolase subunit 1 [Pelagimonas sp.]|jgi:KipI family sensor histidine kinase inhibitor|nr:allophanate hydrolase subunit 1 [Pelagimonas sp.]
MTQTTASFPRIDPVGLDGVLVRFADQLSEPANRAALALRADIERATWEGVEEASTSLVSTYLRFDPLHVSLHDLTTRLRSLLAQKEYYSAALPGGRRLLHIPTVYGTQRAPQLQEAAALAGLSTQAAIESLSGARTRVLTIGFAPGQPYCGTLPACWDIPRQTALTPQVPVGALVVAIRQFVLFSVSTPTGWRHVGQTAARLFQPTRAQPFLLRPGDELCFPAISAERFTALEAAGESGIESEALT